MSALAIVHAGTHGPAPVAKSCEIIRPQFPRAEDLIESAEARQIVANLMWAAFPATSQHACARRAAAVMGCSVGTATNALGKRTDISSTFFLRLCAAVIGAGKDPLAIAGVRELMRSAQ